MVLAVSWRWRHRRRRRGLKRSAKNMGLGHFRGPFSLYSNAYSRHRSNGSVRNSSTTTVDIKNLITIYHPDCSWWAGKKGDISWDGSGSFSAALVLIAAAVRHKPAGKQGPRTFPGPFFFAPLAFDVIASIRSEENGQRVQNSQQTWPICAASASAFISKSTVEADSRINV